MSTNGAALNGTQPRKVSFGVVEIRKHFVTVGDNPACLSGAPITLGWTHDESSVLRLLMDEYEEQEGPKRTGRELFLDRETRDSILIGNGVTRAEINEATRHANIDRQGRRDTFQSLKFGKVHEGIESFGRKFKRVITFTSKEAELEKLWADAEKKALQCSLHGHCSP